MSNDIFIVSVPQLGVNDEVVTIAEWLAADGTTISIEEPICVLETAKATFQMQAEAGGYILCLVEAGKEVRVSQAIALIGRDIETLKIEMAKYLNQEKIKADSIDTPMGRVRATQKAKALALRLEVDLSKISLDRIVREQDVMEHYKNKNLGQDRISLNLTWKSGRQPVVIYGAGIGGIALKECLDLQNTYQAVCFIDDNLEYPKTLSGLPVYPSSNIQEIIKKGVLSLACAIANGDVRLRIRKQCASLGVDLINVIHPSTFISPSVKIGKGNYIKSGSIIETNTKIGDCCIIDNAVVIPHDNLIQDACHLAPGVVMGSKVKIGELTIVGIGVSIATGVEIGKRVIISVGSSVTRDIPDDAIVEGVPGKIIGQRKII